MKNSAKYVLRAIAAIVLLAVGLDYVGTRSAVKALSAEQGKEQIGANVAHSTTLITGGHTNATSSTAGFQSAADKLLWTQWQAGPVNYTKVIEEFLSGGPSGAASIAAAATGTFTANLNWRCVASGTNSTASLVTTGQSATHWGIVQVATGTLNNGNTGCVRTPASTPGVTLGAGQALTQTWDVQWPTISDGTDTYSSNIGWTAGPGTRTDSCSAYYSSAAPASGTIICRACASSSCTSGTGGSPPTVVGGTWYHIGVTWDGTNCACTVDGTNIGSTSSTPPTAAVTPDFDVLKSAGTTSRTLLVDYYGETDVWAGGR